MKEYIDNISYLFIISYLVSGVLLLLLLTLLDKYVIPLLKQRYSWVTLAWLRLQIISWLLFVFLFYANILQKNMILTLVMTLILFSLGWNYWKNIFAGILIKFSNQFTEGDIISTDFVQGKFSSIHIDQSEVINEKGERVVVPNHLLRSSVLKHLPEKTNVLMHPFIIKITKKLSTDEIYQIVVNCPYISSSQNIIISKQGEQEYLIKAAIVDDTFKDKVEDYLKLYT